MGILAKFNDKSCSFLEKATGLALIGVTVLTGCDIVGKALSACRSLGRQYLIQ